MGAWSVEIYGNDTAGDWAWGLDESNDFELINTALDALLEEDDYIDADISQEALAAAEALTFALGQPARNNAYTKSVDSWAKRIGKTPPPALVEKAQRVVESILTTDSELRELWAESDSGDEWVREIQGLLQRLSV